MQYTETQLTFKPNTPNNREILTALLAEIGYDSFMETATGLSAYIETSLFNADETLNTIAPIKEIFETIEITSAPMPDVNWNAEWEKNFTPITVLDKCRIRAPFHPIDTNYSLDIIIEPKMAFGTGHHATTTLMIQQLLNTNVEGKTILDMGCGTGVLSIAAKKLGAKTVTAIDIDHWSVENSIENIAHNQLNNITVVEGGVEAICGQFDIILANINRNILLDQMPTYAKSLCNNGELYISGFYNSDLQILKDKAQSLNLRFDKYIENNDWVSAKFTLVK